MRPHARRRDEVTWVLAPGYSQPSSPLKARTDKVWGISMYFTVSVTKGNSEKFSWWLFGDNHTQVAWAGETFPSLSNAQRAASAFKVGAATATYTVYADAAGQWRWYATRSSDKVASSGEAFDSRSNAQRAADTVKLNAGSARL